MPWSACCARSASPIVEFTPETGSGRINLYAGYEGTDHYDSGLNGGAAFTQATAFWDKLDNLKKYDVILHSCEGAEPSRTRAPRRVRRSTII